MDIINMAEGGGPAAAITLFEGLAETAAPEIEGATASGWGSKIYDFFKKFTKGYVGSQVAGSALSKLTRTLFKNSNSENNLDNSMGASAAHTRTASLSQLNQSSVAFRYGFEDMDYDEKRLAAIKGALAFTVATACTNDADIISDANDTLLLQLSLMRNGKSLDPEQPVSNIKAVLKRLREHRNLNDALDSVLAQLAIHAMQNNDLDIIDA